MRSLSGKDASGSDALSWSSSDFIWDNVLAHGKWFRNYGEWMVSESGWKDQARRRGPQWIDYWNDYQNGTGLTQLRSRPAIESLLPHSLLETEGYNLKVPDVMRAAAFIKELRNSKHSKPKGSSRISCFCFFLTRRSRNQTGDRKSKVGRF